MHFAGVLETVGMNYIHLLALHGSLLKGKVSWSINEHSIPVGKDKPEPTRGACLPAAYLGRETKQGWPDIFHSTYCKGGTQQVCTE